MLKRKRQPVVASTQGKRSRHSAPFRECLELLRSVTVLYSDVLELVLEYAMWYYTSTVPEELFASHAHVYQGWKAYGLVGQYQVDGPLFALYVDTVHRLDRNGRILATWELSEQAEFATDMCVTETMIWFLCATEVQVWSHAGKLQTQIFFPDPEAQSMVMTKEGALILTERGVQVYDAQTYSLLRSWPISATIPSCIAVLDDQVWVSQVDSEVVRVYSSTGEHLRCVTLEKTSPATGIRIRQLVSLEGTMMVVTDDEMKQYDVMGKLLQHISLPELHHICLVENRTFLLSMDHLPTRLVQLRIAPQLCALDWCSYV